jgi:hypothetical protein
MRASGSQEEKGPTIENNVSHGLDDGVLVPLSLEEGGKHPGVVCQNRIEIVENLKNKATKALWRGDNGRLCLQEWINEDLQGGVIRSSPRMQWYSDLLNGLQVIDVIPFGLDSFEEYGLPLHFLFS